MSVSHAEVVRVNAVLKLGKKLCSMIIVGHENEQQGGWPANGQQHKCKSCYEAAKELRAAIAEAEKP